MKEIFSNAFSFFRSSFINPQVVAEDVEKTAIEAERRANLMVDKRLGEWAITLAWDEQDRQLILEELRHDMHRNGFKIEDLGLADEQVELLRDKLAGF